MFLFLLAYLCFWCGLFQDTEFPGVVTSPTGEFRDYAEYSYHNMRVNVNMLKIIQLGLTFFDENGNKAKPISTWQFNFEFNEKYATFVHVSACLSIQSLHINM